MAAAKVGGNSSCTRSNSQADKGRLHEQKPLDEVFCVAGMMLQIDISVWVLQKPEEQRRMGGPKNHLISKESAKNNLQIK